MFYGLLQKQILEDVIILMLSNEATLMLMVIKRAIFQSAENIYTISLWINISLYKMK